jgi:hypothetical protein
VNKSTAHPAHPSTGDHDRPVRLYACAGCGSRFPRRELVELHEDNHDNLTYFHGVISARRAPMPPVPPTRGACVSCAPGSVRAVVLSSSRFARRPSRNGPEPRPYTTCALRGEDSEAAPSCIGEVPATSPSSHAGGMRPCRAANPMTTERGAPGRIFRTSGLEDWRTTEEDVADEAS